MRISDWSSDVCSSDLAGWASEEGESEFSRAKRRPSCLALPVIEGVETFGHLAHLKPERHRRHSWLPRQTGQVLGQPLRLIRGQANAGIGQDGPHTHHPLQTVRGCGRNQGRSEEHTSELKSLMRKSYT